MPLHILYASNESKINDLYLQSNLQLKKWLHEMDGPEIRVCIERARVCVLLKLNLFDSLTQCLYYIVF